MGSVVASLFINLFYLFLHTSRGLLSRVFRPFLSFLISSSIAFSCDIRSVIFVICSAIIHSFVLNTSIYSEDVVVILIRFSFAFSN